MASGNTVTVANKLSFPFTLTVSAGSWQEYKSPENRDMRTFVPDQVTSYVVRGFGAERRMQSNNTMTGETSLVIGHYGLTPNIPEDFWEAWLKENNKPGAAAFPMIRAGLIFAHSRHGHAHGKAQEQAAVKSGTEALIPQTFDRSGKRTSERDARVAPGIAALDRHD